MSEIIDRQNAAALAELSRVEAGHWPTPTDLADSQLELDVERVERALQWDKAQEALKAAKAEFKQGLAESQRRIATSVAWGREYACGILLIEGAALLTALDELQRLEEAGGGL